MAQTNKTQPAGFDEILAGLAGGPRAAARFGRGPSAVKPAAATALDTSWVQSARLRAAAVQMAQRVAAAPLEPVSPGPTRMEPAPQDPEDAVDDQPAPAAAPDSDTVRNPLAFQAELAAAANAAVRQEPPPKTAPQPAPERRRGRSATRVLRHMLVAGASRAGAALRASVTVGQRMRRAAAKKAASKVAPQAAAPKSEDETIAEELGLRADLGIGELRRIRRDFAKKNHPDRFEAAQRIGAARRMTIANSLIDAHLKQKPPSH